MFSIMKDRKLELGLVLYVLLALTLQFALTKTWSRWTDCKGSICFKSRVLTCVIDSRNETGQVCPEQGEPYIEVLSTGCTTLCTSWSIRTASTNCDGICYDSKSATEYQCDSEASCTKNLLQKCYDESTCSGVWNTTSTGPCSVTCGNGVRVLRQECRKLTDQSVSYPSHSCPGSNDSIARTTEIACYNCEEWGEWSNSTTCSESCLLSGIRSCSNASYECGNITAKEVKFSSCSGGLCTLSSPPNAENNNNKMIFTYVPVAGAAVALIGIIIIVWIVVKRRKTDCKNNLRTQTPVRSHVTEINTSQTTNGAPIRNSFGSHYESLGANEYAVPEQKKPQRLVENRSVRERNEGTVARLATTSTVPQAPRSPYTMAVDDIAGQASPTFMTAGSEVTMPDNAEENAFDSDSDSYESDDDAGDTLDGIAGTSGEMGNVAEENVYAEIDDIKRRKQADKDKRRKSRKTRKMTGSSKSTKLIRERQGPVQQEAPYANHGEERLGALMALGDRSIPGRRSNRYVPTYPREMMPSATISRKHQRGITTGMIESRHDKTIAAVPPTKARAATFSTGDELVQENVGYMAMTSGDPTIGELRYTDTSEPQVESVEYEGIGYTDMSIRSPQIQDEYSIESTAL